MAIDNKKEQEREELHRAIWAIADELRGAVDGWDFKNYVLGTMFYRYVSENLTAYINEGEAEAGNKDFDYAKMNDADVEEAREGLVEEKGFFILPSELFCNVRAKAANDENLNETLERVFNHIEESAKGSESEGSFAGLFDDFDVNSNKLGSTVAKRNERLVKLLDGVANMNLGSVKDHDIDAFGDAYEYLMTMYASTYQLNENVRMCIDELENKIPSGVYITGFSSTNSGFSVPAVAASYEDMAEFMIQLKEIPCIQDAYIGGYSKSVDENTGEMTFTFSVTAKYVDNNPYVLDEGIEGDADAEASDAETSDAEETTEAE